MPEYIADDTIILNNNFNNLTEIGFKPNEQLIFYTLLSYFNDLEKEKLTYNINVEELKNKAFFYTKSLNWDLKKLLKETLEKIKNNIVEIKEKVNIYLFSELKLNWTRSNKSIDVTINEDSLKYFHLKNDHKYFKLRLTLLKELSLVNQRKAYRMLEQWSESVAENGFTIANEKFIDVVMADNFAAISSGITEHRYTENYLRRIVSSLSQIFKEIEVTYVPKTSNIFDGSLDIRYIRFDNKALNEYAKQLRSAHDKPLEKTTYKYVNENSKFEEVIINDEELVKEDYIPKDEFEEERLSELEQETHDYEVAVAKNLTHIDNKTLLENTKTRKKAKYLSTNRFNFYLKNIELNKSYEEIYELTENNGVLYDYRRGIFTPDLFKDISPKAAEAILSEYQEIELADDGTEFTLNNLRMNKLIEAAALAVVTTVSTPNEIRKEIKGENKDNFTINYALNHNLYLIYTYVDKFNMYGIKQLMLDRGKTLDDANFIHSKIFSLADKWLNSLYEVIDKAEQDYIPEIIEYDEITEETSKVETVTEVKEEEPSLTNPNKELFESIAKETKAKQIQLYKEFEELQKERDDFISENLPKYQKLRDEANEDDDTDYMLQYYKLLSPYVSNLQEKQAEILKINERISIDERNAKYGWNVEGLSSDRIQHMTALAELQKTINS